MNFKRVSLLTLVYFIGRTLMLAVRHASNFLPLVIVFFAGGEQIRSLALLILPIAIPAIVVLHAFASWWFFRYRVDGTTLHIRDGIFKRKQLTLDYARIQQADVRQPWYFRPFGLSVLGVESAGSEGKEVELAGLSYVYAHELKDAMLAESMEVQSDEQNGTATESKSDAISIALPLSEVARYGLIYNPVLLLIPILLYPLSQLNLLDEWLLPKLEDLQANFNGSELEQYGWLFFLALLVAALLIVIVASVIIAIIRFYGFTLTITGNRYQSKAGLFTIVTRGFQYVRLQRVIWQQGMIARLLRRRGMRVNQSGTPNQQNGQKSFFVPVLDKSREQQLRHSLQLTTPQWQRVHPMSIFMPWLMSVLLMTGFVALISGLDWYWVLHALWVSALISALVQVQSWRRRAVSLDQHWLATRRGLIGEQQRWVPAYKMQTLKLHQGPWLRLWGSCSLHIYSAAGRETIAWLPAEQLAQWKQQLLDTTTAHKGRWM
ncbi:hypothetical protein CWE09_09095 [Aliidiomarina minuta]|uniref:YdbS-like PH domain-containing protein n=1 Tax=Aliidiomarina minuta TaxID=880057 RepID=A0A432WB64_9GAMM|nr:PH domain-containing protein [Aliidiomarina minuta]RUO26828.1 hypothetical protein CWE09_09095 [Aliidiomarina minuta]